MTDVRHGRLGRQTARHEVPAIDEAALVAARWADRHARRGEGPGRPPLDRATSSRCPTGSRDDAPVALRATANRCRAAYGVEGLRARRPAGGGDRAVPRRGRPAASASSTGRRPDASAVERPMARAGVGEPELVRAERLEQERRRRARVVDSAGSGAPGSRPRRRDAAPPRAPRSGPTASATERALGKRPSSIPMTATWSNSRPFVPWAVARVSAASSRRSSASRARAAIDAARSREAGRLARTPSPRGPRRATAPAIRRSPGRTAPSRGCGRARRAPARRGGGLPAGRGPSSSSTRSDSIGQLDPRRPERHAEPERRGDDRQQLAVRPGQDGARRAVVGPRRAGPLEAGPLVGGSGARTRRPSAFGPGSDDLGEPLARCARRAGPRARGPARTAVVRLEVDAAQAGQALVGDQEPPARRRAASRRSTGRRRRRGRSGSPAPRAAAPGAAAPGRGPAPRRRAGAGSGSRHRASDCRVALQQPQRRAATRSSKSRPPVGADLRLVRREGRGRPARRRDPRSIVVGGRRRGRA